MRLCAACLRGRAQARVDAAEWGKDDCISYVFGIDFDRPESIRTQTQEEAFVRAVKEYGGVESMCEEFARRGGYKRVTDGSRRIGDVVVGSTIDEAFCIAKVDSSYLPFARQARGYAVAEFVDIIGVWRLN